MSRSAVDIIQCSDGRSPFSTSLYPDGNRPHQSYTSGGVELNTDVSYTNGSIASLRITGSPGFNFGTGPAQQITFGFGQGYLYQHSVGTQVVTHTDGYSKKLWTFEGQTFHPDPWKIYDDSGFRYMKCTGVNGKAFAWDYGSNLPENTRIYLSSLARGYAIGTAPTAQWKSLRITPLFVGGPGGTSTAARENSFYVHAFVNANPFVPTLDVGYLKNGSPAASPTRPCQHPTNDDLWTLQTINAFSGTFDTFDGTVLTGLQKAGTAYSEISVNQNTNVSIGTSVRFLESTSSNRWRWLNVQDYLDNPPPTQGFSRSDTFFQVGSAARLQISDAATPATSTELYELPIRVESPTHLTFPFWQSRFTNFNGKYLHYYNDAGVYTFSMPVGI
ncbi:hypothetical protein [Paenibacillus koleovorans]|uniref:hypothetical protein n=1 Tax=Paenibacillus koleovorans TaxID=121608 RepID=UPI000FD9521E|nr:hypothetical protein [Paenibacillus koleovorans]